MQEAERKAKAGRLPLPPPQMRALFDFVDEHLQESDCDRSLRHTLAFIESQDVPEEPVLEWLREAGGYCDCEVISNAEEECESSLPQGQGTVRTDKGSGKQRNGQH